MAQARVPSGKLVRYGKRPLWSPFSRPADIFLSFDGLVKSHLIRHSREEFKTRDGSDGMNGMLFVHPCPFYPVQGTDIRGVTILVEYTVDPVIFLFLPVLLQRKIHDSSGGRTGSVPGNHNICGIQPEIINERPEIIGFCFSPSQTIRTMSQDDLLACLLLSDRACRAFRFLNS